MAGEGPGFNCPRCGHPRTHVFDTRSVRTNRATSILRHRECLREDCRHRFYTTERLYGRPSRSLSVHDVAEIRAKWKASAGRLNQAALAREKGVSRKTIWNIVNDQQWVMPERRKG